MPLQNQIQFLTLTSIPPGQQLTIPTEGSTQAAAEPQAAVQEAPVKLNLFKLNNLLYKKRFKRKHKQPLLLKHNLLQQKQRQQARMLQKNGSHKKNQGGSYTATNGRYIGRYQLDSSYLNGDYLLRTKKKWQNNMLLHVMVLGKLRKHSGKQTVGTKIHYLNV